MELSIGIIGSRGIPNSYGGFEQFAEYVALGLVKKRDMPFPYTIHPTILSRKNPGKA